MLSLRQKKWPKRPSHSTCLRQIRQNYPFSHKWYNPLMAKTGSKARKPKQELDSVFFLKIVMYLVLGSAYVRLVNPSLTEQIPIPVGLLLGLVFVSHDHFRIDRKIEISVLLVAALGRLLGAIWCNLCCTQITCNINNTLTDKNVRGNLSWYPKKYNLVIG